MKGNRALLTLTLLALPLLAADEPRTIPGFRIVGYLLDYRTTHFDPWIGKNLTDLIFFSAEAAAPYDPPRGAGLETIPCNV